METNLRGSIFNLHPAFAKTDDYQQIQQLVLWERQTRAQYFQKETADCYFEDAEPWLRH